ncbi:MAG: zinc-ribbon domain-containing protein [Clostridia bacterium]|nr:zinc-ribbon domain-containing protein [Clostridia bacterium]
MKFLIWAGCILAYAIVDVMFKSNGVLLGAIPAVALFSLVLFAARNLCKMLDEHRNYEKESEKYVNNRSDYKCGKCGRKGSYEGDCPECRDKHNMVATAKATLDTDGNAYKIMFCRICGAKLVENSDFCGKCGTKVKRDFNI